MRSFCNIYVPSDWETMPQNNMSSSLSGTPSQPRFLPLPATVSIVTTLLLADISSQGVSQITENEVDGTKSYTVSFYVPLPSAADFVQCAAYEYISSLKRLSLLPFHPL